MHSSNLECFPKTAKWSGTNAREEEASGKERVKVAESANCKCGVWDETEKVNYTGTNDNDMVHGASLLFIQPYMQAALKVYAYTHEFLLLLCIHLLCFYSLFPHSQNFPHFWSANMHDHYHLSCKLLTPCSNWMYKKERGKLRVLTSWKCSLFSPLHSPCTLYGIWLENQLFCFHFA